MIAIQIETKVGRCESCHRFRNNMEWQVESKVVCIDCFKTLKNQRLIDEVVKRVPKIELEPNQTGKRVKKVKEEKPKREITNYREIVLTYLKNTDKPLSVREMYESKVTSKVTLERWLKALVVSGEVVTMRSTARAYYIDKDREELLSEYIQSLCSKGSKRIKAIVLQIIKESPLPVTPLQVNQGQSWHHTSGYFALKTLLNEGTIVRRRVSGLLDTYIDVERVDLLDDSKCNVIKESSLTKYKILDFINEQQRVLAIKDITKVIDVHRSTVLNLLKELESDGLVKLDKSPNNTAATLVAPANNQSVLEELKQITYNSTANKLKRFMELGNAVTLKEIYKAVGCGRGRSSTRKYIQKLLVQWECKVIEEDGIVRYVLETQEDKANALVDVK